MVIIVSKWMLSLICAYMGLSMAASVHTLSKAYKEWKMRRTVLSELQKAYEKDKKNAKL